ncbi:MAG: hypothetical protein ACRDTT_14575 [Pseudonocardiaceae bacterium]
MAQLAVYDAGGDRGWLRAVPHGHRGPGRGRCARRGGDRSLPNGTWPRGPSQFAYLDERYGAYLKDIPQGRAKTDGIEVGEAAAAGVLALRANDGFNNAVAYRRSANPVPAGEFEPNGGCGTEPVDVVMAQVTPFTFPNPAQFRPDGPDPFSSDR